ncbi:MAG: ester cyclase, partial [Rhodothermia bacterium]
FPAGGKKMSLDIAGIFRIADGKIAEIWATWDNLTALTQLGHIPSNS